jgi:hypothetical protein
MRRVAGLVVLCLFLAACSSGIRVTTVEGPVRDLKASQDNDTVRVGFTVTAHVSRCTADMDLASGGGYNTTLEGPFESGTSTALYGKIDDGAKVTSVELYCATD